MLDGNLKAIRDAEEAGDLKRLEDHLGQQDNLKKAERELAFSLGIVVAR